MSVTQPVEIHDAVVNELKGRIRGPLLRPGQAAFDEARSVWNAMIDRHPAMIVRCLGVTDVIACVNAARTHGLPLSIKGGGHNIAGLAIRDGSLLLDMSLMRGWRAPRPGACSATSTPRPSCTASLRCSGSSRTPAARA
jgi:hypothetical protein